MGTEDTQSQSDIRTLMSDEFIQRLERMRRYYDSAFNKSHPLYSEALEILHDDNAAALETPKTQKAITELYDGFYEVSAAMLIFCGYMMLQPNKDKLVDYLDPEGQGYLDMLRTDEGVLQRMDGIISETNKFRTALYEVMSDENKIKHLETSKTCLTTYQENTPKEEVLFEDGYYYQLEESIFEAFGLLLNDLPYDRQAMKEQYVSRLPDQADMLGARALRAAMIHTGHIQNYLPGSYHDEYIDAKEEFPDIDKWAVKALEHAGLIQDYSHIPTAPDNVRRLNLKNEK